LKIPFKIAICVALLLVCGSAIAAFPDTPAQRKVREMFGSEPFSYGVCSVLAVTADGDTLASFNPDIKLVPASNVKLITTGLALKVLGADYRFETRLAYSGEVRESVLHGDIYIIGGADPTLGADYDMAESPEQVFRRWMAMMSNAGIKSVSGRIVGDPRFFSSPMHDNPGWLYEDMGSAFGSRPAGLNFYENRQTFYVTPGPVTGVPLSIYPRYPDTPWMKYSNTAVTSEPGSPNELFYEASSLGPLASVHGSFPVDRKGCTLECSNRFGAYTCAYYFRRFLTGNGISVSGGCADIGPNGKIREDLNYPEGDDRAASEGDLNVIGSTWSPTLLRILERTNHESDNFFAETLFSMLGVSLCSSPDYYKCAIAVRKLLDSMGLETEGRCRLFDGSGLSRKNYVSAAFFVDFLKAMDASDLSASYRSTIPDAGEEESTLTYRLKKSTMDVKARVHMKSGSMDGVRCFSGYIDSSDSDPGHDIIFSLLTDNVPGHSYLVYSLIDEIIAAIAAGNR